MAPGKEGLSRGFESFQKNVLHSCIKSLINIQKKKSSQTTEQADNPLLRYVTVMRHLCIVFVWFVSLKQ